MLLLTMRNVMASEFGVSGGTTQHLKSRGNTCRLPLGKVTRLPRSRPKYNGGFVRVNQSVGPHIAVLKTHVDLVDDWTAES